MNRNAIFGSLLGLATLLMPATQASAQCSSSKSTSWSSSSHHEEANIVETAASVHDLSTLVTAVKAAGLAETLSGDGPFTVFAPTNEAFEKLPAGTVETLLKPENKDLLVKVLTYHVVPGAVKAHDLDEQQRVASVEGSDVFVTRRGSDVRVDNAEVIKADVETSNGVVHVIDRVILPPGM